MSDTNIPKSRLGLLYQATIYSRNHKIIGWITTSGAFVHEPFAALEVFSGYYLEAV